MVVPSQVCNGPLRCSCSICFRQTPSPTQSDAGPCLNVRLDRSDFADSLHPVASASLVLLRSWRLQLNHQRLRQVQLLGKGAMDLHKHAWCEDSSRAAVLRRIFDGPSLAWYRIDQDQISDSALKPGMQCTCCSCRASLDVWPVPLSCLDLLVFFGSWPLSVSLPRPVLLTEFDRCS